MGEALSPQTHPMIAPAPSLADASRTDAASIDCESTEVVVQRSISTAPAASRAKRSPSASNRSAATANPARRQLSLDAARSATPTITLSTQIMLIFGLLPQAILARRGMPAVANSQGQLL